MSRERVFNFLMKKGSYNSRVNAEPGWARAQYVPCEKLFPNWRTARIMLAEFCAKTDGWVVGPNSDNPSILEVGPKYPMVRDILSGNLVPMQRCFPPEELPLFDNILHRLIIHYVPNLSRFYGCKMSEPMYASIVDGIRSYENELVSWGARPFKNEIEFRFGIAIL